MKKLLSICLSMICCLVISHGQELVNVEFRGNVNRATFQAVIGSILPDIPAQSGVDLYKITYTTTGSDMMIDTASGLLCIPSDLLSPRPILNYQHGTTDGRSDVPSNLSGNEYLLAAAFASLGFISYAPDYIGMGESRGFHPYVHAETEALAMIDMYSAITEYMDMTEIEYTDQLFITGYSQGGHAAMAAYKMIEEEMNDQIEVTAALPMSGPYNISGVMLDLVLSEEEFFYPSYVVYATLGIKAVNPNFFDSLTDIFRSEFVDDIALFYQSGENLFDLNRKLISKLTETNGTSIPSYLFLPEVLDEIRNDENHIFRLELEKSDVHNWTPSKPTLMLYCEGDDQVSYLNSVLADSTMNANGALDVSSMDVSGGQNLDHTDCILPALQVGVPWLLSFVNEETTSAVLTENNVTITIHPNPVTDKLYIQASSNIESWAVYDISGRLIQNNIVRGNHSQVNVQSLKTGMYLLFTKTKEGTSIQKFVKQ